MEKFLTELNDDKAVHVTLPIVDSQVSQRLQCIYRSAPIPGFSLIFPEDTLPVKQIDRTRSCVVTVDQGGQNVSITAAVTGISDPQTLQLSAEQVDDHEQLRNYFRVDAVTPISASPLFSKPLRKDAEEWVLEGDTLDLSGSGALCVFNRPINRGENVRIELALPTGYKEVLSIIGHVVRSRKIDETTYHVGLQFDGLTSEDRDKIMACCFELQRRHLKMKIQLNKGGS